MAIEIPDWPIRKWTSIADACHWVLPDGGGCYAIYLDGKLAYIGQSSRLRHRLASYKIRMGYGGGYITPWGRFKTLRMKVKMPKRFGEWAMTELKLIARIQPSLNCVGSSRKRGANVEA